MDKEAEVGSLKSEVKKLFEEKDITVSDDSFIWIRSLDL